MSAKALQGRVFTRTLTKDGDDHRGFAVGSVKQAHGLGGSLAGKVSRHTERYPFLATDEVKSQVPVGNGLNLNIVNVCAASRHVVPLASPSKGKGINNIDCAAPQYGLVGKVFGFSLVSRSSNGERRSPRDDLTIASFLGATS